MKSGDFLGCRLLVPALRTLSSRGNWKGFPMFWYFRRHIETQTDGQSVCGSQAIEQMLRCSLLEDNSRWSSLTSYGFTLTRHATLGFGTLTFRNIVRLPAAGADLRAVADTAATEVHLLPLRAHWRREAEPGKAGVGKHASKTSEIRSRADGVGGSRGYPVVAIWRGLGDRCRNRGHLKYQSDGGRSRCTVETTPCARPS